MRSWLRRERAPLLIALVAVLLQLGMYVSLAASAPSGTRWLGDRMTNATDQAVYLGDIEQIRAGANGLENLYAPGPEAPFWLAVPMLIGWLARWTGWSAVAAHEVVLWLATAFAVFLLHAVSRRLADDERDAAWSTALVVFAGGMGWLGAGGSAPDLGTETFFSVTRQMAAHIPLSFGLLAYALSTLWADAGRATPGRRLRGPLALGALVLVHPYFVPLIGFFGLVTLFQAGLPMLRRVLPYVVVGVLAVLPHAWVHYANPSRRFLLERNFLPLADWPVWIAALSPWWVLCVGRVRLRARLEERERWLVAWMLAIAGALLLPFHWKRKLTEGLGAVVIWLAAPSLRALRGRSLVRGVAAIVPVLVLAASSPAFLLIVHSELVEGSRGTGGGRFYLPESRFEAWSWLRDRTAPGATVLADDLWIGLWTPAYAQRHVTIGHSQETPGYPAKKADWDVIFRTGTPAEARARLEATGADVVLTTSTASAERVAAFVDVGRWRRAATFGEVAVFVR